MDAMKEAEAAVIRAAIRAVHEGFTPPAQSALALAVAQLENQPESHFSQHRRTKP